MPHKTGIRLLGVARNPANGFPARPLRESRIGLFFEEDVFSETDFLALNPGEGYGRLRVMEPDERPNLKDIVIYEALPNDNRSPYAIVATFVHVWISGGTLGGSLGDSIMRHITTWGGRHDCG